MPTHWRSCIESEYLTAADLMTDDGQYVAVVCEVLKWRRGEVRGDAGEAKEKWFLRFEPVGECPPRIADRIRRKEYGGNSTNSQVMESITGSPFMEKWVGALVKIKVERGVRSKKGKVDAIRFDPQRPADPRARQPDRGAPPARPSSSSAPRANGPPPDRDDVPPIGDDPRGGR